MRLIGHVPTAPAAKRFCDYLLARGMPAHAEQAADGQWQIWIEHDDAQDAGWAELARFTVESDDPRYDAAGEADRVRRQETAAAQRRQKNYRDVRTTMFTAPAGAMPVAIALIVLCCVFTFLTDFSEKFRPTIYLLFCDPHHPLHPFVDIIHGQVWRLITPIFLHGDWLHLIFNALWMVDLGRRIEPIKGSLFFGLICLVLAVMTCCAQAGYDLVRFGHFIPFIGISGVVSGLFGYAWMCRKMRPYERVGVNDQEVGYMIGWLVICSTGMVGPIANAAHWGGLLMGAALGALPSYWKRR